MSAKDSHSKYQKECELLKKTFNYKEYKDLLDGVEILISSNVFSSKAKEIFTNRLQEIRELKEYETVENEEKQILECSVSEVGDFINNTIPRRQNNQNPQPTRSYNGNLDKMTSLLKLIGNQLK